MHRAEARRGSQHNHVHTAIDDLLVSVQADKTFVRRNFDLVCLALLQVLEAPLQLLLKNITHRSEDDIFVGVQRLVSRAGPTSPTADQADFESIRILFREESSRQNRGSSQCPAN